MTCRGTIRKAARTDRRGERPGLRDRSRCGETRSAANPVPTQVVEQTAQEAAARRRIGGGGLNWRPVGRHCGALGGLSAERFICSRDGWHGEVADRQERSIVVACRTVGLRAFEPNGLFRRRELRTAFASEGARWQSASGAGRGRCGSRITGWVGRGLIEWRQWLPLLLPRCRGIGGLVTARRRRVLKGRAAATRQRGNFWPAQRLLASLHFVGFARWGGEAGAQLQLSERLLNVRLFGARTTPARGKRPPAGRVVSEVFFFVDLVDRVFLVARYPLAFDWSQRKQA
jgi:hypothetical protein